MHGTRSRREYIGAWYAMRYRARMRRVGAAAVARQLRRQGVPLDVALRVLGIAPSLWRLDRPRPAPGAQRGAP